MMVMTGICSVERCRKKWLGGLRMLRRKIAVSILMAMLFTVSPGLCTLYAAEIPTNTANNVETKVIFSQPETTDLNTIKERINKNISDVSLPQATPTTEIVITDNGKIKIEQSQPTVQKLKQIQRSDGTIETSYVANSIGTIYTSGPMTDFGDVFFEAIHYKIQLYYSKSYADGVMTVDCERGVVSITGHSDQAFLIKEIRVLAGGTGLSYDAVGNEKGYHFSCDWTSVTGSALPVGASCTNYDNDNRYYKTTFPMNGIGVRGEIVTQRYGNPPLAQSTIELKIGSFDLVGP